MTNKELLKEMQQQLKKQAEELERFRKNELEIKSKQTLGIHYGLIAIAASIAGLS